MLCLHSQQCLHIMTSEPIDYVALQGNVRASVGHSPVLFEDGVGILEEEGGQYALQRVADHQRQRHLLQQNIM